MLKVVHGLPRLPRVSPHPHTGLTYILRVGWDRAMQTALKPVQLAYGEQRAHQNSACLRQTGVSMHCITSWMFSCYSNFTTMLPGSWEMNFVRKQEDFYIWFRHTSAFFCPMFSLGGERLSKLKIACRHPSSCVTSLMKAFSSIQLLLC